MNIFVTSTNRVAVLLQLQLCLDANHVLVRERVNKVAVIIDACFISLARFEEQQYIYIFFFNKILIVVPTEYLPAE